MLTTHQCGRDCREAFMRHRLTDKQIKSIQKPGRYADGDGLYLSVSKTGSRSWTFLFMKNKRRREMGLGSYDRSTSQVSLAIARTKAEEIRSILGMGGDPFVEFSERRERDQVSFGQAADRYLVAIEHTWKNAKHRDQWRMTLTTYAKQIRRLPVSGLATDDILRVLKPIWNEKTETASRLRGRMEKVIDFATTQGWRTGENPARWKGHLENVLPSPRKRERTHHAAMPYPDLPKFMSSLRECEGYSARALEFTVLCATRTSETLKAKWNEIDLDNCIWTIPASRMKAGNEHRIPLSDAAFQLLDNLQKFEGSEYLFPGQTPRKPLSNMAMTMQMRRMKMEGFTVHGFRSSFRDWAGEETSFPREIAEQSLAHVIGSEVERAYRRGDALEKRRELMNAWSRYVNDNGAVLKLVNSV